MLVCCSLDLYSHSASFKFPDGTPVTYTKIAHLDTAISYLHVRERTGNNDGIEVERFLRSVGLGKGYAWCAAFVSYCLKVSNASFTTVRSAVALRFNTNKSIPIASFLRRGMIAQPGSIMTMINGNGPYGHVYFIYQQVNKKFYGIEGNTNGFKSREGNGCYPTIREYQPFARLKLYSILGYSI